MGQVVVEPVGAAVGESQSDSGSACNPEFLHKISSGVMDRKRFPEDDANNPRAQQSSSSSGVQPHMQGGGAATAWRASGAGQPQRELTTTAPGSRSPGWRCCSQPAGWRVAEIGWGEVARRVQRRTGATSSPRCETWKYSQTIGLPACIWARAGSRAPCSPAPSCAGSPLLRQAVSEQVRLTL